MTVAGFPHSGITGSAPACGSPMLFAAYHALHRLSVPRHPPCALVRLTGIVHGLPPFAQKKAHSSSRFALFFLPFHTQNFPSRENAKRHPAFTR